MLFCYSRYAQGHRKVYKLLRFKSGNFKAFGKYIVQNICCACWLLSAFSYQQIDNRCYGDYSGGFKFGKGLCPCGSGFTRPSFTSSILRFAGEDFKIRGLWLRCTGP